MFQKLPYFFKIENQIKFMISKMIRRIERRIFLLTHAMRQGLASGMTTLVGILILPAAEPTAVEIEFFEKKIRPVLAESCYECHNSVDKKKGKIALDYRDALLESDIIVPGDPAASPLIQAIRHAEDYEPMPDKAPKLANVIIKNFEDWIRMGAPDPRVTKPTKEELESQVDWNAVRDKRAEWWSFQPIRKSTPPPVSSPDWGQTVIDRFIYAQLSKKGLAAQSKADPGALVRRLHLVLTGLPPSPEVVKKFVAHPTDGAYVKLVDELMASERYGERWGRYWLDWFRYAESYGSEGDPAVPYATQYRDYVIRAINNDVPYDQLVREAVAGDLLEKPRVNEKLGLNESAIGPAYLRMVPHGFGVTDAYDEQITFTDNAIDVLSKATLGLTVSCARCHNHKFDPVSQKDFYKFYGIMTSSRPAIVNVDSPTLKELHVKALLKLKDNLKLGLADFWAEEVDGAIERLRIAKFDKVPTTDPLGAWAKLRGKKPAVLKNGLIGMSKEYAAGLKHNAEVAGRATFYADLRDQATYDQWFKNGNGLGGKVSPAGSFAVAVEGKNAIKGIYPRGVYSHLISEKHNATLNSVYHLARGERNAIRAMGEGSIVRFTMRAYPLSHGGLHPAPGLKPKAAWVNLNKYKYWNGDKGYYHVNTGRDSTYRGGGNERSWFGVFEVYAGSEQMRDLGAPVVSLPGEIDGIEDEEMLVGFYKGSLAKALIAWKEGSMTDAQAWLLNSFVSRGLLPQQMDRLPAKLRKLIENYRKLEGEIRVPVRAPGFLEGEPWDQPLLTRGSYKDEEEPVARGFLEVFSSRKYTGRGSGRRELAEDLVNGENSLTARVIVNRLWHHTFGRGLVASTDNFGRLGKEPSHPALLDHLAADFRDHGWSMKRTVRQLVLSRAFQSASIEPRENAGKDSANEFLAYYPPRRLDAEAILDTINFVSTNGVGQRAVYKSQKRNRLDPFLKIFNYPIPTSTVGVRDLTNVPAQSLMLMNGPIVQQAARKWSDRVRRMKNLSTDQGRINQFFLQAYARNATDEEMHACLTYLAGKVVDHSADLVTKQQELERQLAQVRETREKVVAPVRARLQAEVDRRNAKVSEGKAKPVDLKPFARWDFDNDTRDMIGSLHGVIKGKARIDGGALVLEGGCVMTSPLTKPLKDRSLEVLVQLDRASQRGGGAMVVQNLNGSTFDGIVYAEVTENTWLSGSDFHRRTKPFKAKKDVEVAQRPVRIVMTYSADGTVSAYRDGKLYGKPYRASHLGFRQGDGQVVFGLRHGSGPGGGRMLTGRIFEARLYDRVLTPEEVAAGVSGTFLEVVTDDMLSKALNGKQKKQLAEYDTTIASLAANAGNIDRELTRIRNAKGASGDAYYRIAHAILNSKELIYVY